MRNAECGIRNQGAAVLVALTVLTSAVVRAEEKSRAYASETLRGRVVFLAEAMEKRTGAAAVAEAKDRILALETQKGALIPLLEDVRGRAFRRDERLRKMQVELLVRRYQGSPAVQIIRVFEVAKDGLYELDYWCDICAIAMYELKDCECCQGPIALRRTKVK